MCYMHIMEYYSALKRRNPVICYNRMNLEDIVLSEIRQSQKTRTAWFHLHGVSKAVKLSEGESRMVAAKDWGKGEMRTCCSIDMKFQCKMKKF